MFNMARALFQTCLFFLFVCYSSQNSHDEDELSKLKIFGIEQFCASHNFHHVKSSKLICLLCKGFDMSCLLKSTTAASTVTTPTPTTPTTTTSTTTTPTTTPTTTTSTTTSTTTASPNSTTSG